jgi:hypothetical protein
MQIFYDDNKTVSSVMYSKFLGLDIDKTVTWKNLTALLINRRSKGKAIPLQAWTAPEGSRRLRLPDFKTIGT